MMATEKPTDIANVLKPMNGMHASSLNMSLRATLIVDRAETPQAAVLKKVAHASSQPARSVREQTLNNLKNLIEPAQKDSEDSVVTDEAVLEGGEKEKAAAAGVAAPRTAREETLQNLKNLLGKSEHAAKTTLAEEVKAHKMAEVAKLLSAKDDLANHTNATKPSAGTSANGKTRPRRTATALLEMVSPPMATKTKPRRAKSELPPSSPVQVMPETLDQPKNSPTVPEEQPSKQRREPTSAKGIRRSRTMVGGTPVKRGTMTPMRQSMMSGGLPRRHKSDGAPLLKKKNNIDAPSLSNLGDIDMDEDTAETEQEKQMIRRRTRVRASKSTQHRPSSGSATEDDDDDVSAAPDAALVAPKTPTPRRRSASGVLAGRKLGTPRRVRRSSAEGNNADVRAKAMAAAMAAASSAALESEPLEESGHASFVAATPRGRKMRVRAGRKSSAVERRQFEQILALKKEEDTREDFQDIDSEDGSGDLSEQSCQGFADFQEADIDDTDQQSFKRNGNRSCIQGMNASQLRNHFSMRAKKEDEEDVDAFDAFGFPPAEDDEDDFENYGGFGDFGDFGTRAPETGGNHDALVK